MSTKSTIKYGDDFHFYHECFDNDNVYLELDNAEVEHYGRVVTLKIPKAIWAIIREAESVELPYAKMKDEELESIVKEQVEERMLRYSSATDDTGRAWANFIGCIPYGGAGDSFDDQFERGMSYYKGVRKHEKKTLNRIRKYQRDNKR